MLSGRFLSETQNEIDVNKVAFLKIESPQPGEVFKHAVMNFKRNKRLIDPVVCKISCGQTDAATHRTKHLGAIRMQQCSVVCEIKFVCVSCDFSTSVLLGRGLMYPSLRKLEPQICKCRSAWMPW